MKIRVTDDDIREGCRSSARDCMVARAIRRQTGLTCVCGTAWLTTSGRDTPTPPAVARRMTRWDNGEDVRAFSFELPDGFIRGGNHA